MTSGITQHSSRLPWPTEAILANVHHFQMLTSSQLRRLVYRSGTPRSKEVRASKHFKRLTELGMIKRIKGPDEFIYLPPDSKARSANMHRLDITELGVRLITQKPPEGFKEIPSTSFNASKQIIYDPEPWHELRVGQMVIKPDAYVDTGRMRFLVEIDRSTEYAAVIRTKCRRYISAYEQWQEATFPQVLFVVHDTDRLRFIENIRKQQSEPRLFKSVLFDDAVKVIDR